MSPTPYIVGLDLGQAQDPTALAVIERSRASDGASYAVRHLKRWPLRTAYTEIVEEVTTLLRRPPLRDTVAALVVDATGVGSAVVDLFKAVSLGGDGLVPVTITPPGPMRRRTSRAVGACRRGTWWASCKCSYRTSA